jgi:hypothetical protein
MKGEWKVEVVHIETEEVVKAIECNSERSAERVERGVLINMNHEDYFTRIVGPEGKDG